jgi:hypothetical protein
VNHNVSIRGDSDIPPGEDFHSAGVANVRLLKLVFLPATGKLATG